MTYDFQHIEQKWQSRWQDKKTYLTPADQSRPKYYVLDMFPYPSGHGLHVGHLKGYVASDVMARFKRMQGYAVLHPMGWDAFGLPAERQAMKENLHPAELTKRNIEIFRQQLMKVGLSYDWSREISTTDESFYAWTQWIFKRLYEKGLAYQADVPVNWCPALNTVLANEEVKDGVYIETGDPVEQRTMRQWMLRITAYADRLIDDLDDVDWPESVKEMQRQWIGRSRGAQFRFDVPETDHAFEVFTTRIDTLFGCSYCTLAPEHPLSMEITASDRKAVVEAYISTALNKSERERMSDVKTKTGVFTGAYAINPVNGKKVPIWIADYVLMNFGTGAVFGCPAHDQRDFEFAKTFDLPINEVVQGGDVRRKAYTGDGPHINSGFLDGLKTKEAKARMIDWLTEKGIGQETVNYRLRDWLFSRQRYWGEPFPVITTETGQVKAVRDEDLPITLPHIDNYSDTHGAMAPLGGVADWVKTIDPETGEPATREINTMPQWAGSSWYFLRFCDPHNDSAPWGESEENYWMPVDLYVGGVEHATLHLLYARFWHKFLFDEGLVSTNEPFKKLFNQGMIKARSFRDDRGRYYYPKDVKKMGEKWVRVSDGQELNTKVEKMSKSRYNVVTPDEVIHDFGADTLRVFEAFLGPVDKGGVWQTSNIVGSQRFLERVHHMFSNLELCEHVDDDLRRLMHQTIKKVTHDIESLNLNTAVSQLMIFLNEMLNRAQLSQDVYSIFARLLCPFAPHLAEECWEMLGEQSSITHGRWPEYDAELAVDEQVSMAVQVNGKTRGTIHVPQGAGQEAVEDIARSDVSIARHITGHELVKIIFVPERIINFILRS